MKALRLALALGLCAASANVRAQEFGGDDMNGFIGLGYAIANHSNTFLEEGATGTRSQINVEFARLSSWISLQFGFGSGLGYSDTSARFRVFRPIQIPDAATGFLLLPTLGFEASHSSGGIRRSTTVGKTKFTDLAIIPELRFMYDFKFGLGVSLDAAYEFVTSRRWSGGDPRNQTKPVNKRLYFGLTLMMDSRLIE